MRAVILVLVLAAASSCTLLGVTIGGLSGSAANSDIDEERASWRQRRAQMITTDEELARCKETRTAIFQRADTMADLEARARVLGTLPSCTRVTQTAPPPEHVSVAERAGIGALVGFAID